MGIENMRRWPLHVACAVCFLLLLSLINSWSIETELRKDISDLDKHLQESTREQSSCTEKLLSLIYQKDKFASKVGSIEVENKKVKSDVELYKTKLLKSETAHNRTQVSLELCTTELQSLNNLQVSRKATLETLRLEKDTLASQLLEKKQKIEELEKEVEKLKTALASKSTQNLVSSKVSPAPQPPKQSPPLSNNGFNEPVVDNDAKEIEDNNALNEDFDQQIK